MDRDTLLVPLRTTGALSTICGADGNEEDGNDPSVTSGVLVAFGGVDIFAFFFFFNSKTKNDNHIEQHINVSMLNFILNFTFNNPFVSMHVDLYKPTWGLPHSKRRVQATNDLQEMRGIPT